MATFFTADTHFGHANIIRFCERPFRSVEEMDRDLIANWNARVGPRDTVFHLGDFAVNDRAAERILARLAGEKILIRGNHDKARVTRLSGWSAVHDYYELRDGDRRLVLFHYPMEEWNGYYRDAAHLHGHVHGRIRRMPRRLDVGVDCWDMAPVALERVTEDV